MLPLYDYVIVLLASVAAGFVNALAGGGTLISFPVLTAIGIPPVAANITNTLALCPGYFGGSFAQRHDLKGQGKRLWVVIPAGIAGGLAGGFILLNTGEKMFRELVPFLILMASGLLAVQEPLKKFFTGRVHSSVMPGSREILVFIPVCLAAVYGGYFGAGMGVILLAVLGLIINDSLTRINALKQTISLFTNVTAAVFFLFSGKIVWPVALVMASGALAGGSIGGRMAGKVRPSTLRWIVVTTGVIVALFYLIRV